MIGGYNRIFLQPPRSALRGRSRSAGTTALSALSPLPKAGAERAALPVLRGAPDAGGISAARTVGRFSAESRHRSRVPSLIKVPVSSPFRGCQGLGIIAYCLLPDTYISARECSALLWFVGFPCAMPRFSRRLPFVPVPYRPVRPWSSFVRRTAAAFPTPVVKGALG